MKKTKFNLAFTVLAASALMLPACVRNEPLTADNDAACRDRDGNIVDDDYCGDDDGNGGFIGFMFLSSNGYKKHYGKYPKSYNPRSYAGKTTSGFAKSHGISRGGFGSSARGMSSGG